MRSFRRAVLLGIVLLYHLPATRGQAGAQLTGSVEDVSGTRVPVTVTLISLDRVIRMNSEKDGSFHFAGIPPAIYDVEVTASGFRKQTLTVDLLNSPAEDLGAIELRVGNVTDIEACGPPVSISYEPLHSESARITGKIGTFYGKRKMPLAKVEITVQRSSDRQLATTTQSDRFGKFTITNIPPDRYTLHISARGHYSMDSKPFLLPRENEVVVIATPLEIGRIVVCQ